MIKPFELTLGLPMEIANKAISTTDKVWEILLASRNGDLTKVKALAHESPGLLYAQYNYTPPIHFAVREGHTALVEYLLVQGAHDPGYRTYPFREKLETLAEDRGFIPITNLLKDYTAHPERQRYSGENGRIFFERSELQTEFEKAVDRNDLEYTGLILKDSPGFAADPTYFWGEGILLFAAKRNHRDMADLLMAYGAKVPDVLKWTQKYYFEHPDGAAYMMQKGMNPNTMSWHHVTILHDMAIAGDISKAALLLKYGAEIDAVEEEYQSTPLGLAARWGNLEMAGYLLEQGANPKHAGADWATPLA
ncbi:ankyrin repeat domain-containing protein [Mucilaginibacter angelicae]|uniref:Ankyrin repeat domain-containing protein n=1 Tax=Mucilaginibacter angelicae TaxID=869718 RepID=A0ABV6L1E4_9SPHI